VSRILLTWELGLNLGHLTRLLPLAQRLRADGHAVLVASRDMQAAATILGPAGVPFVQAPHLPTGIPLAHRATGYADILLSQGWSDRSALWGLTQGWVNLLRMFNPDRAILDYSPTMSLAARVVGLPTVLVGNGFELPPATDPLPHFPGFSWASAAKAAVSEALALSHANWVLQSFGGRTMTALRDLMTEGQRLLVTYPELDHYGPRSDVEYIGPLHGQLRVPRVDWPEGVGPKIFACLRPDTSHVQIILSALASIPARVVCVAAGFSRKQLEKFLASHIRFASGPVDLESLSDADLCITYGAEGTMLKFLAAGVPQLVSPWHVETFMAVRRVEACGLGSGITGSPTVDSVTQSASRLCTDASIRQTVKDFARRLRVSPDRALSSVCDSVKDQGPQIPMVRSAENIIPTQEYT
jgi:UDP:flavonoid glycosyltransferase YjiC (YdhE family)